VTVVGAVPAGFPAPLIPAVHTNELGTLLFGAAGISLVSFCSMMTTARGFAAKNGYRIDVNRDMFALGVCDLASAFNRGFVVSGADSRTAVADSAGGKTQVASLVAAVVLERAGVAEKIGDENLFRTVHAGAKSFQNNSHGVAARS
jgi:MFS superfamily sulfate permease-like transporter